MLVRRLRLSSVGFFCAASRSPRLLSACVLVVFFSEERRKERLGEVFLEPAMVRQMELELET